MYQKQLELLKLLRDATRNGRAIWQRQSAAAYYTELAGLRCSIRFKHPLLAGDDGSGADAVEVIAALTVWTFYSGTEGYDLAGEILEAAYPEIREHNQRIAVRLEETLERIRRHSA